MSEKKKFRSFILTIPFKYNNKIIKLKWIKEILAPFEYLVLQLESGNETNYKHYQVYVEYKNPRGWTAVHKLIPFAHVEERKGSQRDAFNYCTKEDTRLHGPFEFGERPLFNENGSKSGLKEKFVKAIMSGASDLDLLLGFPTIFKKSVVDEIRDILNMQDEYLTKMRNVEVHYICGPSGSGKTSYVYRNHDIQDIYVVSDYDKDPFGSYNGQSVILFDEYRSNFSITQMLQYLDIYPCMLPSRYKNKIAKYTTIYILSNWKLEQQYLSSLVADKQAFYNRIKYRYIINYDYIFREEYTRQGEFVKKLHVLNPLGKKHLEFPKLPTSFEELMNIGE